MRRIRKWLILMPLISFAVFGQTSFSDELPTETIYFKLYFVTPPLASGTVLASNIEFEFKGLNLTDVPLNFSVGDFDYLHTVRYEVIHWGAQGCAARITCRYNSDVSNDTAEEQTDIIANYVLAMFNQQQLNCFFNQRRKDSSTGELIVLRDHGYFPDSTIIGILQHRPQGGFGALITEEFLSMHTMGEYITFVNLEYTIRESAWDFDFEVCSDLPWNGTNDVITLNVNEMVATGAITSSPYRKSLISMVLYKSYKKPDVTYSMSIESITPPNYTEREEDENTLVLTYDLSQLEPIQVSARVEITMAHVENPESKILILVGVISSIIITSLIAVLLYVRRREKKVKNGEEKSAIRSRIASMFNHDLAKHRNHLRATTDKIRDDQRGRKNFGRNHRASQ
jgi:hypothetical protein